MFHHPAWAVGSYSSGPPAARSAGTKSTIGFPRPLGPPCIDLTLGPNQRRNEETSIRLAAAAACRLRSFQPPSLLVAVKEGRHAIEALEGSLDSDQLKLTISA